MFNHPDQKLTFLELFYKEKDTDTGNKKISLVQPFLYTATFLLIFSASMRHVSLMCNLNYNSLLTSILWYNDPDTKYRVWYIAGAGISALLSSFLYTFVFQRKMALTLIMFQSFNIVF